MKKNYILILYLLSFLSYSQEKIKTNFINYGKTKIEFNSTIKSFGENEILTDTFYAKWIFVKKEPNGNEQKMADAINPFEKEVKGNELGKIVFNSDGNEFTGIKYKCTSCNKFKFKILSFGKIDGELVILNICFLEEPKSNSDLDWLMKKFIILK
ncbi:hypothetical protein DI487_13265 [Flavobacterium sediminis]|uniref:Uncharacterized protein n=1 Tax=Flavobacterium sediminis TaxID=2201181 RepID=A0A2U8QXE6_9FLAO|nr:hypothetical protein [Flavobacterium sediminis]AWM14731.1 hypothetical protein DI487_13265 [Flavobacterium sediminis]